MRALTLTQPWASLVALGKKRVETRSFMTRYRGPLAIHAAKGFPGSAKDLCISDPFRKALGWPDPVDGVTQAWLDEMARLTKALPRGEVVAICKLEDCLPTVATVCLSGVFEDYPDLDTEQERAFGNYDEGRYGWVLEEIEPLTATIPAKGALGIWNWKMPGGPA
jgi:hypothetical protein